MRVDAARLHLDSCRYGPVQCAGCTQTVSRCELPEHHVKCAVIAAVLGDDDDGDTEEPGDAIGISRQVRLLVYNNTTYVAPKSVHIMLRDASIYTKALVDLRVDLNSGCHQTAEFSNIFN